MTAPTRSGEQLAQTTESAGALTFGSGSETAAVAEALYVRLFVVALGCLAFVCGLAIVVALARTHNANFMRTTALALAMALLAWLALQAPARSYRAIRRRPVLSLIAPLVALVALVIDGVLYSPLSYPAAVSIAFPAVVCGQRWALAAATLISVGAIATATLHTGLSALNSVGQGAAGYFAWAVVLAGLAECFARLAMQMPPTATPPTTAAPPIVVPMVATDPPPVAAEPATACETTASTPAPLAGAASLTARQLQVLALLADGLRAEDIARRLGITTATVYRHIDRAKKRTGVRSRGELVAVAMRDGLLPPTTPATGARARRARAAAIN